MNLKHLTDATLLTDAKSLAGRERHLTTQILWHIKEIDRRKLYADLKYPSLWAYVTQELGYSEGSAQRRITAARALEEMPELEEKIASGDLTLVNLAFVLGSCKDEPTETKREIIAQVEKKTAVEVKAILEEKGKTLPKKAKIEVDQETLKLIQQLKDLRPQDKDVLKTALQTTIKLAEKQRLKIAERPRATAIVAVKRNVFSRDHYRCRNCGSRHGLEIDHIRPKALGGGEEQANLRVLCRSCNQRSRMKAKLADRKAKV